MSSLAPYMYSTHWAQSTDTTTIFLISEGFLTVHWDPHCCFDLFFLVFKSLNINANFVLLLVSNTTETDCFVFFFSMTVYAIRNLLLSCPYISIFVLSSCSYTFYCFSIYEVLTNRNKHRWFVHFPSFICFTFFPLQCCSQFLWTRHLSNSHLFPISYCCTCSKFSNYPHMVPCSTYLQHLS